MFTLHLRGLLPCLCVCSKLQVDRISAVDEGLFCYSSGLLRIWVTAVERAVLYFEDSDIVEIQDREDERR